jgi:hypothetical protein
LESGRDGLCEDFAATFLASPLGSTISGQAVSVISVDGDAQMMV